MSPAKKPAITQTFEFDSVVVEVSMLSNYRDYRIWQAWFGKVGSPQKFWASFKLMNGTWFGSMAYYIVARTVIADFELALNGVKAGPHQPFSPQIQDLETYRSRLEALSHMLDRSQVRYIFSEASHQDRVYNETGSATNSLHNARALILERQLPVEVSFVPQDLSRLYVNATWSDTALNLYEHEFDGFTYGQFADISRTIDFFRMIGYYMSENEFRRVRFPKRRFGPKEWSPHTMKTVLRLGEDYGKEDFQPGEHDL